MRRQTNRPRKRWPTPPLRMPRRVGAICAVTWLLVIQTMSSPAQAPLGVDSISEAGSAREQPGARPPIAELPPRAASGGPQITHEEPVPLEVALNRRGELRLQNSSLNEALMTISELWKINIVAGDVPGTVNGVFKDAPLREILDSILISNGYGYRAVGESLVVSELAKLGQLNPFFESETIHIAAANINDVVAGASLLSTPGGQIRPIPSASSIFVLDFPDRVKIIREFAASVDAAANRAAGGAALGPGPQELQVAYLKTHFVTAAAAQTVLETVLSPSGRVAVMEDEDRLLAVDYAKNLEMIATVLERIDQPRPQVCVRALIYDINLQDMEEIGLNWQSLSGGSMDTTISGGGAVSSTGTLSSGTGTVFNSLTKVPVADGSPGSAFTFFTLNSNFNLAAVAIALQQANDSRLLASPNVTVVDNDEATIQSVSEIPFQQLTQTSAGGNIGTTAFREAGVTLQVTPKIAMDGTIEMLVRPEFSRLTGFTPGDSQPIIDRRTAETRVRVNNGQTFVIAGLRQRTDVGDFKGIPLLKDVRFLGHLFRARETDIRESELVVFISPAIVGYDPPLSPRDRATADTVNCRLAQIPQAEGCPPGYCCGPYECATAGPPCPTRHEPHFDDAAPNPNDNILPIPAGDETGELVYPEITRRSAPRRLPAVTESPEPTAVATAKVSRESGGKTRVASRLRPDYDARYRATGGVYPNDQRQKKPAAEEADKPATSLWRRFWR